MSKIVLLISAYFLISNFFVFYFLMNNWNNFHLYFNFSVIFFAIFLRVYFYYFLQLCSYLSFQGQLSIKDLLFEITYKNLATV